MSGDRATPSRRLAAATLVLGAAFVALLVRVLIAHGRPLAVDRALHTAAMDHRAAALTAAAIVLSAVNEVLAYLLAAIGGLLTLRPRPWWIGALAGVAALGAGQLVRFGLSVAIRRARPPGAAWMSDASGYAFPSGHTTTATLGAGLLVLGLIRVARGAWRAFAVVVAIVWAAAVGWARVYLGVHWPTDVLGGWLLGGLLATGAAVAAVPFLGWNDRGTPGARRAQDVRVHERRPRERKDECRRAR